MTILICIPCLLTGGTEIQTLNLVQALVAGGHRVVTTCYFEYSDDMVVRFRKVGSEVVCLSPPRYCRHSDRSFQTAGRCDGHFLWFFD